MLGIRLPRDSDFEEEEELGSSRVGIPNKKSRKRESDSEARPPAAKKQRTQPPQKDGKGRVFERKRQPTAPKELWQEPDDEEVEGYEQRVLENDINFFELGPRQYIAEVRNVLHDTHRELFPDPWQSNRGRRLWTAWTNVIASRNDELRTTYSCSNCEQFTQHQRCVHTRLLEERHGVYISLSDDNAIAPAVLFYHEEDNEALGDGLGGSTVYKNILSVDARVGSGGRRGRCFVRHCGPSLTDNAVWMCSCEDLNCQHIPLAHEALMKEELVPPTCDRNVLEQFAALRKEYEPPARLGESMTESYWESVERSVSWKQVAPPKWLKLPSDRQGESGSPPRQAHAVATETTATTATSGHIGEHLEDVGEPVLWDPLRKIIPLSSSERSRCRYGHVMEPTEEEPTWQDCVVYDLTQAYNCTIQVHRCNRCPSQSNMFAGPDCRDLGLFNYNNNTLLSHTLLNSFDGYTVVQEGTFHAWHDYTSTIYMAHSSCKRLLSVERFVVSYFTFIELQNLADSFICELCGTNARILIGDGVTISYQKRRATAKLKPPTVVEEGAPDRPWVRPLDSTRIAQLVTDRRDREDARKVLKWSRGRLTGKPKSKRRAARVDVGASRFAALDSSSEGEADEEERDGTAVEYTEADVRAVARRLDVTNPTVGKWFRRHVKRETKSLSDITRASAWGRLLEQIVAEESVLQFATHRAIGLLTNMAKALEAHDDVHTPWEGWPEEMEVYVEKLESTMPAFGEVAVTAFSNRAADPSTWLELLDVATWIVRRAEEVRAMLEPHKAIPPDEMLDPGPDAWKTTGNYGSKPIIRQRCSYSGIRTDGIYERNVGVNKSDIQCPKYFATYGKKGYTGGIFAIWCPHSICYQFHCIPSGEGRNDVHSAFWTRWEEAPEFLIYDYACAAAPYCMLREADYWHKTVFLIDSFHSKGHTKCGEACMLDTYRLDDIVRDTNSSAGESGNGFLKYIRKTVRYMTERHAIRYTHRFLCIRNRKARLNRLRRGRKGGVEEGSGDRSSDCEV